MVEVLGDILEEVHNLELKGIAQGLLKKMEIFEFVFMLHLMKLSWQSLTTCQKLYNNRLKKNYKCYDNCLRYEYKITNC